MAQWNGPGGLIVFNDSILTSTQAIRRKRGVRLTANNAEARRTLSANAYWSVDASGQLLSHEQLHAIRALELHLGFMAPVLLRLSSYDRLETEHNDGTITPAPLGIGDGTTRTFQLQKEFSVQDDENILDPIHYPWHDYPPLQDLNGHDWEPLPPLKIFEDGVDVTSSATIDRLTGQVTIDTTDEAVYTATGGFMWRMLMPQFRVSLRAGIYVVSDGVTFEEPLEEQ